MINDFLSYLRKPEISPYKHTLNAFHYLTFFLFLQLVTLPFAFIDQIPALKSFFNIGADNHLSDFLKNKFTFFISVVLFAPIVEELIFRFFLPKPRFIVFLFLSVAGIIVYSLPFYKGVLFWFIYVSANLIFIFYIPRIPSILNMLNRFQQNHFKLIFFVSAFLFGIVHIFNYQIEGYKFYLATILVIPQILAGFYLGYLRIQYGIWLAIITHMLDNLTGFLIYVFFYP